MKKFLFIRVMWPAFLSIINSLLNPRNLSIKNMGLKPGFPLGRMPGKIYPECPCGKTGFVI